MRLMNKLLPLLLLLSGCSLYMETPDWETGAGCWKYGISEEANFGAAECDAETAPVVRLSDKELMAECGNLRGCADPHGCVIYLPSIIYAGHYEETHERCHLALGRNHNRCSGLYATDKEWCEGGLK